MREAEPSRTAARVAERRALHQLLDVPPVFRDPLAFDVLPAELARQIRDSPHESSPVGKYLRAFLAARSRFVEDELARRVADGLSQYVIVGAGFDTFAYRNPYPGLRVFELDHPATQTAKRQRLGEAGITVPPIATLIPVDLATQSLADALASSGFDRSQPAVFSWLGVVPYLERDAIESTLRAIASGVAGTTVIFDYGIPRDALGLLGRIAFDRLAARVAAAGEPWKSFFVPSEIAALLRNTGFHAVEDYGAAEINALYFANRADRLRVGEAGRIVKGVV